MVLAPLKKWSKGLGGIRISFAALSGNTAYLLPLPSKRYRATTTAFCKAAIRATMLE
jgi:hypothetical protein